MKAAGHVRAAVANPNALPPLTGAVARPLPAVVPTGEAAPALPQPPVIPVVEPAVASVAPVAAAVGPAAAVNDAVIASTVADMAMVLKGFYGQTGPGVAEAWTESKVAMRHFSNVGELLVASIGTGHDTPETLGFLMASSTALAAVFETELTKNLERKKLGKMERVELESLVHAAVGLIATKYPNEPAAAIKRFVDGMRAVYSDPAFALRQQENAQQISQANFGAYQAAVVPETAVNRLAQSRHFAHLRLYEAATDHRLVSPVTGVLFSYQRAPEEVARRLVTRMDRVMADLAAPMMARDDLTADQRTTVLQSWNRLVSTLMSTTYIAEALRLKAWIKDGQKLGDTEFKSRIVATNKGFDAVVEQCGARAATAMTALIDESLPRYAASSIESEAEIETSGPAPH